MSPSSIQVRCVEAQAFSIIKIYRSISMLGDSVPFKIHPFVVPLLYKLQRSLGISILHLDISVKWGGTGLEGSDFWI